MCETNIGYAMQISTLKPPKIEVFVHFGRDLKICLLTMVLELIDYGGLTMGHMGHGPQASRLEGPRALLFIHEN